MCDPGSADLSADVDFLFLKQAILKGSGMFSYQVDKGHIL
jgi:SAM-dependent MidA family methyltransferase